MRKKVIVYIIIVIVAAVCGFLFYRFSQPSGKGLTDKFKEKAVSDLLGRKAEFTDTTPKGDKIYKGKTITFVYPAKAIVYNYRENSTSSNSAAIEDFSFDIKEPKLVFNLQATKAQAGVGSISDIPAVRLRDTRSYEYKKALKKLGKVEGVVYTKSSNGGEKTGFWMTGDVVYSISITGSDTQAIDDLFTSILSSAEISGQ